MAGTPGKKGKRCGKGFVSAKKKCKANFRQAVSEPGSASTREKEPREGAGTSAAPLALGLGVLGLGAVGLGVAAAAGGGGIPGGRQENRTVPPPPVPTRGVPRTGGNETSGFRGSRHSPKGGRQSSAGRGSPLSFGKTDWTAPGNLPRSEVERILAPIEEEIRGKDREWVAVVDGKTGRILSPPTGGTSETQVELPEEAMKGNAIITHNHPDITWIDGSKTDGGPFSPGDVEAAMTFRAEMRAVSREWDYCVRVDWSKMEELEAKEAGGGDPDGLASEMRSQYQRVARRHEEMLAEVAGGLRSNLLTGRPVPGPHEVGHKAMLDLAEEFKHLGLIYEAKRRRRFTADSIYSRTPPLGAVRACIRIRTDVH